MILNMSFRVKHSYRRLALWPRASYLNFLEPRFYPPWNLHRTYFHRIVVRIKWNDTLGKKLCNMTRNVTWHLRMWWRSAYWKAQNYILICLFNQCTAEYKSICNQVHDQFGSRQSGPVPFPWVAVAVSTFSSSASVSTCVTNFRPEESQGDANSWDTWPLETIYQKSLENSIWD